MYSRCPKQWELCYVKKHKVSEPNINLTFGSAFHETLQTWLDTVFNKSIKLASQMNLPNLLQTNMMRIYKEEMDKFGQHYSSPAELAEYYEDGVAILEHITKKRSAYFPSKGYKLIGIEMPLNIRVREDYPKVRLIGFMDLVIYNENSDTYTIYDIKTSYMGWKDNAKKDKTKTSQLVLYKEYFSRQWNLNPDKVEIEFFIVKRKILQESVFPQKRVQEFTPASGSVTRKKLVKSIEQFVADCFSPDGSYNVDREYPAIAGPANVNCKYCEFKDKPDLCPAKSRIKVLLS